MKKLILLVIFLGVVPAAVGYVSVKVYYGYDGTPWNGEDIMVGTWLVIILDSNVGGYWVGDIAITGNDVNYGLLSARDYNEVTFDYEGSRFEAAGSEARVWDFEESGIDGFSFSNDDNAVAGDWYIIDYNAIAIGNCTVRFYENYVPDSNRNVSFVQVHTRDFNNDAIVNFGDFAILASHWLEADCSTPGWCEGTDLNTSGNVDCNDLASFADYWLEKLR